MDPPLLTTLHLHAVAPRRVPAAIARMALDRPLLRGTPGLRFAKLLGTAAPPSFTARDADPRRWGLLAVWDDADALAAFERSSPVAAAWRHLAVERWRADLALLRSRGRWSGREPFGPPTLEHGPPGRAVAVLTRARLRPRRALAFWRATGPVGDAVADAPGLRLAIGVGEAPVGLQGTFSVWDSAEALRTYAYATPEHREAVRRTAAEGWYAEDLFARFVVLQTTGTVAGADPLARRGDAATQGQGGGGGGSGPR